MKPGRILFVRVHVRIQMLIKLEHAAQQMHQMVPEVLDSFFYSKSQFFIPEKTEFAPTTSPSPMNPSHDQFIPIAQTLSPTIPSTATPTPVPTPICMMCNSSSHEDPKTAIQKDFINIKSLSSRLIVSIHSEEVEKQLLR